MFSSVSATVGVVTILSISTVCAVIVELAGAAHVGTPPDTVKTLPVEPIARLLRVFVAEA